MNSRLLSCARDYLGGRSPRKLSREVLFSGFPELGGTFVGGQHN